MSYKDWERIAIGIFESMTVDIFSNKEVLNYLEEAGRQLEAKWENYGDLLKWN